MCQTDAEMRTWRGKCPGLNIENELKKVPPTLNPYQSTTDRICYRCHEHSDDIASILDPGYGLKPAAVEVVDEEMEDGVNEEDEDAAVAAASNEDEDVAAASNEDEDEDVDWITLVKERGGRGVDKEELAVAPLRSLIPCMCRCEIDDDGDFVGLPSRNREDWSRCILQKVSGNEWEVFDETRTELIKTVLWESEGRDKKYDGECLAVYWGTSFVNPVQDDIVSVIESARNDAKQRLEQRKKDDDDIDQSPKRRRLREKATSNQKKQAATMSKRAKIADGSEFKVGDIVQVKLHHVDTTKVDPKNITAVVVEISKYGSYKVACKQGVIKNWYEYHRLSRVSELQNNRAIYGLDDMFEYWMGAAKLSEREAAKRMSIVGGQGVTSCGCRGRCVTKSCTCVKDVVFCNSRCHKGNTKCENCDRTDLFLPDNLKQQLKKNEKSKKKSKKK
jgi:hypothetical protein